MSHFHDDRDRDVKQEERQESECAELDEPRDERDRDRERAPEIPMNERYAENRRPGDFLIAEFHLEIPHLHSIDQREERQPDRPAEHQASARPHAETRQHTPCGTRRLFPHRDNSEIGHHHRTVAHDDTGIRAPHVSSSPRR